MPCPLCLRLESELARLERIHAEKIAVLKANEEAANGGEYRRLHTEASDARLDLDVVRLELGQHKRNHQKAN